MGRIEEVRVPDIGDFDEVDVVEVLVSAGDRVAAEDSLITLESDKASMEVPSPTAGVVQSVAVKVGDKVSEGALIVTLELQEAPDAGEEAGTASQGEATDSTAAPAPRVETSLEPLAEVQDPAPSPTPPPTPSPAAEPEAPAPASDGAAKPHASPSVRRFARQLGVDLVQVQGRGPKGRILHEDVQSYVKETLRSGAGAGTPGLEVAAMPTVDFSKFGPVEEKPLNRIRRVAARNLHRSWVHVPHVTQFDEADITHMEEFRQAHKEEAAKRDLRFTPLVFLMKASVAALKEFPDFNSSLDASGEKLILKRYFHIAIAVDTPQGLVVPVIRDVDRKGLYDLARELGEVSVRAREGKLSMNDLQGGCFTISSLGGIGGTAFTPIVNAPEVAILGVSRSAWKPVYQDGEFVPRLILPLSLSYDHRVIDGAAGARFTTFLKGVLGDIRRLLL